MQEAADAKIEDLLADLSEPQRQAVTHTNGPLLILAGPGSGKTRVVTRRAAYLAATVTDPWHILAITFTNKAASEMRDRIADLGVSRGMTVCTFHALCAKLLRRYSDRLGVPKNFTIFDRDDRRKLIRQAVEDCNLSASNWSPAAIDQDISRAKNALLTAKAYTEGDLDWRERTIARIYTCYEGLLAENAGLDFDDLLMKMASALDRDAELRGELEAIYRYVLVDEYQDTNSAQYQIARLLTRDHQNLCATGDPDQSIYGWRGADISNILRFEEDYPRAVVVKLEQNYRSTQRILAAADALIVDNVQRKEKTLWTQNDAGPLVRIVEHETGDDEARTVAEEIGERIRNGAEAADIAVFYRVNALSRVLEEAMLRSGVSYQIARGLEFYNRREIKDVLAYLRVLVNPSDGLALARIINTPPRGIGATTIQRLTDAAQASGTTLLDAVTDPDVLSKLGRGAAKVRQFGELLTKLAEVVNLPAPEALEYVISHSGLRALYRDARDGDDAPAANLDELVSAAAAFQEDEPEATLIEWLEHAALIGDVDAVDSNASKVTLMTLHAAKGLEFDAVYIVGFEDGLLPFRRHDGSSSDASDTEEERRLCFVGMTRAKTRLCLSRAKYRMLRGVTQRTVESPFLDALPTDAVDYQAEVPRASGRPARRSRGRLPDDLEEWTIGTLVRHPLHGLGRVLSIERGPKRTHVAIEFKDGSHRSWVLEFADLERVDFDEIG